MNFFSKWVLIAVVMSGVAQARCFKFTNGAPTRVGKVELWNPDSQASICYSRVRKFLTHEIYYQITLEDSGNYATFVSNKENLGRCFTDFCREVVNTRGTVNNAKGQIEQVLGVTFLFNVADQTKKGTVTIKDGTSATTLDIEQEQQ